MRKRVVSAVIFAAALSGWGVYSHNLSSSQKMVAYQQTLASKVTVLADENLRPGLESKPFLSLLEKEGLSPVVRYVSSDEARAIAADQTRSNTFDVVFSQGRGPNGWNPMFFTLPVVVMDKPDAEISKELFVSKKGASIPVVSMEKLTAKLKENPSMMLLSSEEERIKDWISSLVAAGIVSEKPQAGIGGDKWKSVSSFRRTGSERAAIDEWSSSHVKGQMVWALESYAIRSQVPFSYPSEFSAVRYGVLPVSEKGKRLEEVLSKNYQVKKEFATASNLRFNGTAPAGAEEKADWLSERVQEESLNRWVSLLRSTK